MKSKIAIAFDNCKKEKRPALITYTVAGDNTKNNSLKIQAFPALSVNPVDVTGAGDSMLAILSASITSGSSLIEAAALASYGASLVVESLGNQPVTIKGILERIENCLDKIHKSGEEPEYLINALKQIIDKQDDNSQDNAA